MSLRNDAHDGIRQRVNQCHLNSPNPLFHNGDAVNDILNGVSMAEAYHLLCNYTNVPHHLDQSQDAFTKFCAMLPDNVAEKYIEDITKTSADRIHYAKCLRLNEGHLETEFLDPVDDNCIAECITKFSDATGNEAMKMFICVVCARELEETLCKTINIDDIPHPNILHPPETHMSHILSNDMLLYSQHQALLTGNISICNACWDSLIKKRLPRLLLANNLWLGHIPVELSVLSLPE